MMKVFQQFTGPQKSKDNFDEDSGALKFISPILFGAQTRYGNNRWEVYSPKLKRNVTLYSNLEYDHWVLVEADPEIRTFCEQPLKIRIRLPVGDVTTIFDMWVGWKSGAEEFREVKYSRELIDSKFTSRAVRQIEAQKKWCHLQSKKHSIVTEETIRSSPIFLKNWKLILRHLASVQHIDLKPYIEQIILKLPLPGESTIAEIERTFSHIDPSIIRSAIFSLLHLGALEAALADKHLDTKTPVRLANNEI